MSDDAARPLTVSRREALAALMSVPASALLDRPTMVRCARDYFTRAAGAAQAPAPVPRFFTAHEWRTVHLLADLIIPRDHRSGSATDAGVPAFIDFMMLDQPDLATPVRGGLRWLDATCRDRFGAAFVDCSAADRTQLLDAIAWPEQTRPEMSHGVAFFSHFRDLTASGFWTSPMGVADLQYLGNTVVHEWTGCPQAALDKLGVSY